MNLKLKQLFINDPDMLRLIEQRDTNQLLKSIASKPAKDLAKEIMIELISESFIKSKGDPGKDGYTPIKGVDYFDGKSIKGDDGYTPIKGVDYFTEKEVKAFINKVVANIPKLDTVNLSQDVYDRLLSNKANFFEPAPDIISKINTQKNSIEVDVIKGWNSITAESVVELIKKKKLLGTRDIQGMPLNMNDMRWHGGGLSTISHDATLTGDGTPSSPLGTVSAAPTWSKETPSGLIDGANTTYTILHTPTTNSMNLIVNGQVYTEGVDYTISGTTITMTIALDSAFSSLPFIAQYTY